MGETQFRRYTTLPFLLDILYEKRLPLLDPSYWEDKNDSYFIELYKKKLKLKSLLAICFAEAPETYHHWKIYAGDPSGVSIDFYKDCLIQKTWNDPHFRHDMVRYRFIDEIKRDSPSLHELPFLKRSAFGGESEYRFIYEDAHKELKVKYLTISSNDISCIYINPWVPKSVYLSIKSVIKKIPGFENVQIQKSTIVENEKWKAIGDQAFKFVKQAQLGLTKNEI